MEKTGRDIREINNHRGFFLVLNQKNPANHAMAEREYSNSLNLL
jgi:hypothetical protein